MIVPVDVDSPSLTEKPKGGAIGVGTWATQAEFKDLKVTQGDQTLWSTDLAEGTGTGSSWVATGRSRATSCGRPQRARTSAPSPATRAGPTTPSA